MGWTWHEAKARYEAAYGKPAGQPVTNGHHRDYGQQTASADNPAYIDAALTKQLGALSATPPGERNLMLFVSAKVLGGLPGIDRDWLRDQLIDACHANRYIPDDGMKAFDRTVRSGYAEADRNPRIIPEQNFDDHFDEVLAQELTGHQAGSGTPVAALMARVGELETDFWERESLRVIFDAALSRLCPPWAVLAHCIGRALALVPPCVALPPIIGGSRGGSVASGVAV